MIYRAAPYHFHGYNKTTYNKNIINEFTYLDINKKKLQKTKYYIINT